MERIICINYVTLHVFLFSIQYYYNKVDPRSSKKVHFDFICLRWWSMAAQSLQCRWKFYVHANCSRPVAPRVLSNRVVVKFRVEMFERLTADDTWSICASSLYGTSNPSASHKVPQRACSLLHWLRHWQRLFHDDWTKMESLEDDCRVDGAALYRWDE